MLTTIHLHGRIGKLFGRQWRFDVSNISEALACIMRARKDFIKYLHDAEKNGIVFRVLDSKGRAMGTVEELQLTNTDELHVYPIVIGSKRAGLIQTIIGVVLIIIGIILCYYLPGAGTPLIKAGGGLTTAGYVVAQVIMIGVSLTIGGIIQMTTPMPKMEISGAEKNGSNIFNGSNLTSRQGMAIPVGYGKMHMGGLVISAGMYSDNAASLAQYDTGGGGGGEGDNWGDQWNNTDGYFGDGFNDFNNNNPLVGDTAVTDPTNPWIGDDPTMPQDTDWPFGQDFWSVPGDYTPVGTGWV